MARKKSRGVPRKLADTDVQIQSLWHNISEQCVSIASSIDTTPTGIIPHEMRNRWLRELRKTGVALGLLVERLAGPTAEAYRPQAYAGLVTDKAHEEILFRAAQGVLQSLAPYPRSQRIALLPSVVRVLLATFLEDVAGQAGDTTMTGLPHGG